MTSLFVGLVTDEPVATTVVGGGFWVGDAEGEGARVVRGADGGAVVAL